MKAARHLRITLYEASTNKENDALLRRQIIKGRSIVAQGSSQQLATATRSKTGCCIGGSMMIGVLLPLLLLQCASACQQPHQDINGFDFVPNVDIQGNNLPDTSPYQPQPGDVQGAATACLERIACKGFSTDGELKHTIPRGGTGDWLQYNDTVCAGTYVRLDTDIIDIDKLTVYDGHWGKWADTVQSPHHGSYACGARMSVHPMQIKDGFSDNMAWSGLQLVYCSIDNWFDQETVEVQPGFIDSSWFDQASAEVQQPGYTEGTWEPVVMCPYNTYITGAQIRFEDHVETFAFGDNTAGNGLKIRCANPSSWGDSSWELVHPGFWGEWKPAVWEFNRLVCGAKVRVQEVQGWWHDDTGINGLELYTCLPSVPAVVGQWEQVAFHSHGINGFTVTSSSTAVRGSEMTAGHTITAVGHVSVGPASLSTSVEALLSTTLRSEIARTEEISFHVSCPQQAPWLWRWRFDITVRKDFHVDDPYDTVKSVVTQCTSDNRVPKCPPGSCSSGSDCQTCCMESGKIVMCTGNNSPDGSDRGIAGLLDTAIDEAVVEIIH